MQTKKLGLRGKEKLQKLLNDAKLIPIGGYCYTTLSIDKTNGRMKVRLCPFIKRIKVWLGNKKYFGDKIYVPTTKCLRTKIKFDLLLDDRCKLCGINDCDNNGNVRIY